MEVFGVNIAIVTALSVIVLGMVEWFKTPAMPSWAIRLLSFVIAYAVVGLVTLGNPFIWQEFVKTGAAVAFMANGIWQGANQVGIAITKK